MAETKLKTQAVKMEDFLQVLNNTHPYKLQFGSATLAVSAGSKDYTITLPTAWGTEHKIFMFTGYPASSWSGADIQGVGIPSASPLTTGFARIGSTGAQNFTVYWISIGY